MTRSFKADLHVHSKHSDSPKVWFLDKVNARECWTEPEAVYQSAIARGMELVTISDHDLITGALEIMHHGPHVFISEEVSMRFPETGCIAHVLVYDITEAQHDELQRLRYNIYDSVAYVRQEGICHSLAHPLSAVNHRLTHEIVQKMFLMFKNMELLNGPRDPYHYHTLKRITASLTRSKLEQWANIHDIEPVSWEPRRHWTGGSDDHSGHTIARCYTIAEGEPTVSALKAAINSGATTVEGDFMTAESLGHTIYAGALNYFKENNFSPKTNIFSALHSAVAEGRAPDLSDSPLAFGMFEEIWGAFLEVSSTMVPPTRDELFLHGNKEALHTKIYAFVGAMLNAVGRRVTGNMAEQFSSFQFNQMFHEIPKLLELGFFTVPYFVGFRYFYQDRSRAEECVRDLDVFDREPEEPRVAIFTDTIDSVNGVSLSLRRLADQLSDEGHVVKILGLEGGALGDAIRDENAGEDHIVRFSPLQEFPLFRYTDMRLGIPPLLAVIDYVVKNRITLIQVSTPGPMGLAGLLVGKLLGIRIVGNYHTQVPEFAQQLYADPTIGQIVRGYVRWFYGALEQVIVASYAAREYLIEMGIRSDCIEVVPRGVDVTQFSPSRRAEDLWESYGLNGTVKLLYVGRVSKEKNLDDLLTAYNALRESDVKVEAAIVGDGPYRSDLERDNNGSSGIVFTGFLEGEELATAYASADIFVFPSTTDTFGNAVLEAQASGLPAIVTDQGGPSELVEHNRTGYIVPAGDAVTMTGVLQRLIEDGEGRARMSVAARHRAEQLTYHSAAQALWRTYSDSHTAI